MMFVKLVSFWYSGGFFKIGYVSIFERMVSLRFLSLSFSISFIDAG